MKDKKINRDAYIMSVEEIMVQKKMGMNERMSNLNRYLNVDAYTHVYWSDG